MFQVIYGSTWLVFVMMDCIQVGKHAQICKLSCYSLHHLCWVFIWEAVMCTCWRLTKLGWLPPAPQSHIYTVKVLEAACVTLLVFSDVSSGFVETVLKRELSSEQAVSRLVSSHTTRFLFGSMYCVFFWYTVYTIQELKLLSTSYMNNTINN